MIDIYSLLTLSNSGLYAFINDLDRRVHVGQSKNIFNALNRILGDLNTGCHSSDGLIMDFQNKKLKFVILETDIGSKQKRMLLVEKYNADYVEQGYSLYTEKKVINLKVSVKVETLGDLAYKALVVLSTDRSDQVVGIFDKMSEANKFVQRHYSKPPFVNIVYSDNKNTVTYLAKLGS